MESIPFFRITMSSLSLQLPLLRPKPGKSQRSDGEEFLISNQSLSISDSRSCPTLHKCSTITTTRHLTIVQLSDLLDVLSDETGEKRSPDETILLAISSCNGGVFVPQQFNSSSFNRLPSFP